MGTSIFMTPLPPSSCMKRSIWMLLTGLPVTGAASRRMAITSTVQWMNCNIMTSSTPCERRSAFRSRDSSWRSRSGVDAGAHRFFEGCLPIEILAMRERRALAFGPMRPVGLSDPRTGRRPYALLQLRQDNLAGSLYNLVGFQTNLTFPEQRRIFRMIPGLESAEFARYGQMHRNTFIFSPAQPGPYAAVSRAGESLLCRADYRCGGVCGEHCHRFAGGLECCRYLRGDRLVELPQTTMLGALCHYISHASAADFQPMKANYGLLPALENSSDHGGGSVLQHIRSGL